MRKKKGKKIELFSQRSSPWQNGYAWFPHVHMHLMHENTVCCVFSCLTINNSIFLPKRSTVENPEWKSLHLRRLRICTCCERRTAGFPFFFFFLFPFAASREHRTRTHRFNVSGESSVCVGVKSTFILRLPTDEHVARRTGCRIGWNRGRTPPRLRLR